MAILIAITIVAGFGSFSLRGLVVYPVPPLVHVHGLVFLTWIGVFIGQTLLIQRDQLQMHRRLGWFAILLAAAMIAIGSATALESVRLDRVPPFFTPSIFLALSFLELASFGALLAAAIVLRRESDWHRRFMLGATIAILGPAWGRILPMPLLGAHGGLAVMSMQMLFVGGAMAFDWRQRGAIHPAHFWILLAIFIQGVGTPLLAMTPPFIALAAQLAPA